MQDNTITQALTNESSRLVLKKLWVDTAMDARPSDTTPAALTIYFEVCGYTMNVYDPTQYKELLRRMQNIERKWPWSFNKN